MNGQKGKKVLGEKVYLRWENEAKNRERRGSKKKTQGQPKRWGKKDSTDVGKGDPKSTLS